MSLFTQAYQNEHARASEELVEGYKSTAKNIATTGLLVAKHNPKAMAGIATAVALSVPLSKALTDRDHAIKRGEAVTALKKAGIKNPTDDQVDQYLIHRAGRKTKDELHQEKFDMADTKGTRTASTAFRGALAGGVTAGGVAFGKAAKAVQGVTGSGTLAGVAKAANAIQRVPTATVAGSMVGAVTGAYFGLSSYNREKAQKDAQRARSRKSESEELDDFLEAKTFEEKVDKKLGDISRGGMIGGLKGGIVGSGLAAGASAGIAAATALNARRLPVAKALYMAKNNMAVGGALGAKIGALGGALKGALKNDDEEEADDTSGPPGSKKRDGDGDGKLNEGVRSLVVRGVKAAGNAGKRFSPDDFDGAPVVDATSVGDKVRHGINTAIDHGTDAVNAAKKFGTKAIKGLSTGSKEGDAVAGAVVATSAAAHVAHGIKKKQLRDERARRKAQRDGDGDGKLNEAMSLFDQAYHEEYERCSEGLMGAVKTAGSKMANVARTVINGPNPITSTGSQMGPTVMGLGIIGAAALAHKAVQSLKARGVTDPTDDDLHDEMKALKGREMSTDDAHLNQNPQGMQGGTPKGYKKVLGRFVRVDK